MPMYTFHIRSADGSPISLEVFELQYDGETFARAGALLEQHVTCDHVEVWHGDRPVLARFREQPIIRPIETTEA